MNARPQVIAQKLINLYRSAFAINGGWAAVNKVFIADGTDAIIAEVLKFPGGKYLYQHIQNLKSGATKMDSIAVDLLPYNGMMTQSRTHSFDDKDYEILIKAIENFEPDPDNIRYIKSLPIVTSMGLDWINGVRQILRDDALLAIWQNIVYSDRALELWSRAGEILGSTPSDYLRAEVQADMPEYETYLPMFGKDGLEVLTRLRQYIV